MISKNTIYGFTQAVTPPFIFVLYRKSPLYTIAKKAVGMLPTVNPTWLPIRAGLLKGRALFLTNTQAWQTEMLDGTYDSFFFDYLAKLPLEGKTILEVGAHIGYHALAFAEIVGPKGKVVAFEPNPFNIAYMKELLERNPDLASRIVLKEIALSSEDGSDEFLFSEKIDEGISSGSFIDSADTIWEKSVYETQTGFRRMTVPVIRLDSLEEIKDGSLRPDILKIDIEGAEGLMLEGARETIGKYHPLLLIEVHSIHNMYEVLTFLADFGYTSTVLKKENDGRCFLACKK